MDVLVQNHVDPPPIPLIKSNVDTKLKKYYVKTKLCRNSMPNTYGMYELKVSKYDNGETKGFFQINYQMTLELSGSINSSEKYTIYVLSYVWKLYVNSKLYLDR